VTSAPPAPNCARGTSVDESRVATPFAAARWLSGTYNVAAEASASVAPPAAAAVNRAFKFVWVSGVTPLTQKVSV
jgi:hypothetical protein